MNSVTHSPLLFAIAGFGVAQSSSVRPDLSDINLSLSAGETLTVLGREGSGRALLRDLMLGIPMTRGAFVGGIRFGEAEGPRPRLQYLPAAGSGVISPYSSVMRQLVGILAQRENLPKESAREELRLAFERLPNPPSFDALDRRSSELLPRDLAAGFLALCLAGRNDALIADDPAAALDPVDGEEFLLTLAAERARMNLGLVYFTGNPETALKLGGRIAVLRDGKIVEEGEAAALSTDPANLFTQTFFQAIPQMGADEPARSVARSEPLLQVRGLTMERTKGRGYEPAKTLNFELRRGGSLALIGMRKSGRHAFMRAILGLEKIGQGKVILDSVDIGALSSTMRDRLRQKVAFLPGDDATIDPRMTVFEYVAEPIRAQVNSGREERMRIAEEALNRVGMGDIPSRRFCGELDKLNKRRIQIARALTAVPQLLVLLEPLQGLDVVSQAILLDLIKWLRERRGVALLLVTADFRAANALAENALVLRDRQLVERGSVSELLNAPRDDYTKALAGAANVGSV